MPAPLLRAAALPLLLAACTDYGLTAQAPPEAPVVVLTPEAPRTADRLQAELIDPDSRARYEYSWFRDGERVPDLTSENAPSDLTAKGELWQVVVSPFFGNVAGAEGRAQVEILNTPPTVELAWAQEPVTTFDDLSVLVDTTDDDGDEVSLSYRWAVDGLEIELDGPDVPFDLTTRGEIWEVTVTPTDLDDPGAPVTLAIEIDNTPPELDQVVITPEPAFTLTTLRAEPSGVDDLDGDEVELTFDWYVDGLLVQSGLSDTLTAEHFVKHERVHVEVTPTDGLSDGDTVQSAEIAILNTPPVLDAAAIVPDVIQTGTDASCEAGTSTDDDGDAVSYRYLWELGGAEYSSGPTLTSDNFERGSVLLCVIIPNDGEEDGAPVRSASVTVANTPPVITGVDLTPSTPTVGDVVLANVSGASDVDGDTVGFRYAWTVNGSAIGATNPTLTSDWFSKGDRLQVTVTPTDGIDDGDPITSSSVTVANTPPVMRSVTLSPVPAYTNTSLTAAASATDADADALTYTYTWYIDGGAHGGSSPVLGSGSFVKGDVVYASVTASDGDDTSAPMDSSPVTISNSAPTRPVTPTLTPSEPDDDDSLVCTIGSASTDIDRDALTYDVEFTRDGAVYGEYTTSALSYTLSSAETEADETWSCRFRARDDEDLTSAWSPRSATRTIAPVERCTVVEGWDTGAWGSGWSSRSTGSISSAYRHDGAYGIRDPGWSYNTGSAFTTGYTGERIQAWVRGGSGRVYISFDARSTGAKSFVLAYNTNDIRFQNNSGYGFTELTTRAASPRAGRWYLLEVEFDGTAAIGRWFDSDGTSLLGSVRHNYGESLVGGVAVRAFSGGDIDTLTVCR